MIKKLKSRVVKALRAIGRFTRQVVRRLKSKIWWYALVDDAFDREVNAVLEGVRHFEKGLKSAAYTQSFLRRNTHRIEKGLLMRPFRKNFAASYIEETVDALTRSIDCCSVQDSDLSWCSDVLRTYFALADGHPAIDRARQRFQEIQERIPAFSQQVPYVREFDAVLPTYDALHALARQRRSVRWFRDQPVPNSMLEQAMDVARESPSACNRQPFVFRAFHDKADIQRIASISYGTAGYVDNIPCIIVVLGQLRNFYDERDRHLIYIDASLAAMAFAFALEVLGLSSCIINWPDIEEKERAMKQLLGLEDDERPVFLMAVGYADPSGKVARSSKKPANSLLINSKISSGISHRTPNS